MANQGINSDTGTVGEIVGLLIGDCLTYGNMTSSDFGQAAQEIITGSGFGKIDILFNFWDIYMID